MHIHARSLKYFDMIRRCGSIRGAARRLHLASSAVNRQLLQLEEELGNPLFERLSGGLRLTPAGEIFSHHVTTVLQDEQRMVGELDALKGLRRGELSVVSVEGLNVALLPDVLQQMLTRYPRLRITVRSTGSNEAAKAVADGDADVALGYNISRNEQLQQYSVGRFALGIIVTPDHPLASQATVKFAECTSYPLILPGPELSIRTQLQPLILNSKKPLTVLLESASVELAKRFAIRGMGLAFQTRIGIEEELASGKLVHVPLKAPQQLISELGVYVRSGRSLPASLDAFIRIIDEEITSLASAEMSQSSA
ncbi:LysR family transcriptional regulator [Pseudomonas fluorescens]|nr:LysR family transcriptional regulator [Pseudomonas fluorescens]MBD8720492.1 LysR family transcriptional regulator [Pseudomonas fluorescens]